MELPEELLDALLVGVVRGFLFDGGTTADDRERPAERVDEAMLHVEGPAGGPLARDVDCNGERVGHGFANAAAIER